MFAAKVIADTENVYNRVRLTTMELTYPRFVHAEFMTHRMFSRNSASSRAIPTDKLILSAINNPAMPVFWGKLQKGMSANEEIEDVAAAKNAWLLARDRAVDSARSMKRLGLHKQLTNRVLEPFLWHTVICTATEWSNFFSLRDHKDAQPEIAHLARLMKVALSESVPTIDNIHLPYISDDDIELIYRHSDSIHVNAEEIMKMVSSARCARVSYLTHDGKRDIIEDLKLFDHLITGSGHGHWSPMEHPAIAIRELSAKDFCGNFRGWKQYRKTFKNECQ